MTTTTTTRVTTTTTTTKTTTTTPVLALHAPSLLAGWLDGDLVPPLLVLALDLALHTPPLLSRALALSAAVAPPPPRQLSLMRAQAPWLTTQPRAMLPSDVVRTLIRPLWATRRACARKLQPYLTTVDRVPLDVVPPRAPQSVRTRQRRTRRSPNAQTCDEIRAPGRQGTTVF